VLGEFHGEAVDVTYYLPIYIPLSPSKVLAAQDYCFAIHLSSHFDWSAQI
jgi:hypothetical protein